jgi:hypothetical protein
MEVPMADVREMNAMKDRRFGGRLGSRKTLWLTVVFSASLVAVGALYIFPQFW